jgi:hypothetical protein
MRKVSPWSCQYGDFQARNYSSYPGPLRGVVTAQGTFEHGIYYNPLITPEGETVVALKDSIVMLDRKLNTTWEQRLCEPRALALCDNGSLLVGCKDGIAFIRNKQIEMNSPLPEALKKETLTPFIYIVEGPSERLYTLTGDAVFCLDKKLDVLWAESLSARFGLFGGWRMAINDAGEVFVSGAFSWTNEDESIEYAGYLGALSSGGEFLWQKNHDIDCLPTRTGLSLRLSVTSKGVWLSDGGAVSYDIDGKEVWRSETAEGTTQIHAITPLNEVIYAEMQELMIVSEKNDLKPRRLLKLRGWPHEICTDCHNNLYVLSTEGLEGWSPNGDQLFLINGLIGDKIAIGEGFLLVSTRRGKISLIE